MIRINMLHNTGADAGKSRGFLDFDGSTSIQLKRENDQYLWAQPRTARSTEFTVPATDANRLLLGFPEDPAEYGATMRMRHKAQMQFPGGEITGRLDVTKYDGGRYSCVFYYPVDDGLDMLANRKLADCLCTIKGLTWNVASAIDADDPSLPNAPVAVIKYKGTYTDSTTPSRWCWLPSVNAKAYIENILDNMGINHDLEVSRLLYLVSPTVKGSGEVSGTVVKTGLQAGTIDAALSNYLEFNTSGRLVEWSGLFGLPVHTDCWSFSPKMDIKVTLPNDFPANGEIIHVNGNRITFLGDRYRDSSGWHGEPLAGRTIEIKSGVDFFFVIDTGSAYGDSYVKGWSNDAYPFSFTLSVAQSGDILQGDVWKIQNNPPDMTVVEFLRSLALMEGKELFYDVDNACVVIASPDVGSATRKALEDVAEVVSVSRHVTDWGANTKAVTVRFDSEDYVTDPLTAVYGIDSDILTETVEHRIKWNEANDSADGDGFAYVEDVTFDGQNPKITAKKWTAGLSGYGTYLKRVSLGDNSAASVIASNGTCVVLRALMDMADFIGLTRDAYFTWRGVAYVWTSAEWSQGVATLTLQVY